MQITEQGLMQAITSYREQEARARSAADAARGAALACEYLLGVLRSAEPEQNADASASPDQSTPAGQS